MDPKRELSSVDLAALTRELGAYEGAVLDKAYLYGDDLVRLKLRDFDRGRVELIIEVGDVTRAHVADPAHVPDAPGRPPDFAMMLRNRLSGANLVDVSQYEFDRILEFSFEREDHHTSIVAEFFGDGNLAVLDANRDVIDCLDTVRLQSRTVVPGSRYEFPASRINPLSASREVFDARMRDSDTDLVRTLATQLNLGGFWAEELCTRAGVEKGKAIDDAGEDDFRAIYDALSRLADDLAGGDFDPRIYREDDSPVDVAPFPLEEREAMDLEADAHDTFNGALDTYFFDLARGVEEETDAAGESARPDFEEEIARCERIIDQQEEAIERFAEQADAEREKAELLYARYDLVDEILSTVTEARESHAWEEIEARLAEGADRGVEAAEAVTAVNPESGTVTIELDGYDIDVDPREGVEKNANELYEAAKEIEAKREGALGAVEGTRDELAALERRRDAWEADEDDTDEEEDDETESIDWLSRESIPVRQVEQWYERFRWFHTSDGYLVLGGRNADQNEELVEKYLERGDRFFHAQAHGAPATILKAAGPSEPAREIEFSEQTLEEAAQFAVSYSSVWKNGRFAGDVYMVDPDQVSKTPESGEYLEKGSFAIRGDRVYFDDTPVGCAVGIKCEPETRVIGGPPSAITGRAETAIAVEPGQFAQADVAKRVYRAFRERFTDTSFVRSVASPDLIGEFLPPGGSRIVDE